MASVTLAESAKLTQDMLVAGVIENVITVNPFFDILPFHGIEGNALAYNRENALGDVQFAGVGTTITAKNPATFSQVTSALTTIVGDAEVNGLIQATRSNVNNQRAVQIASKAKSAGRQFQNTMLSGDGTGNSFEGLLSLVDGSKSVAVGGGLSFAVLDQLMDLVTDKDGQVDYFMMPDRTLRTYLGLLRALGGAGVNEVVNLPGGRQVPAYRNVPIFRNQWMPTDQGAGSDTTVLAGTLDDGSMMHGIAGLTAESESGIQIVDVGESETKDEHITRVKWYCGLALFSLNGLAAATGISD